MIDGDRQMIKFKRGSLEVLQSQNPVPEDGQPIVGMGGGQ